MPVKHGKFYGMRNEAYAKSITSQTNQEDYETRIKRMEKFGDVKWWKFDENFKAGARKIAFYQLNAPDVLLVTEERLITAFENSFDKELISLSISRNFSFISLAITLSSLSFNKSFSLHPPKNNTPNNKTIQIITLDICTPPFIIL